MLSLGVMRLIPIRAQAQAINPPTAGMRPESAPLLTTKNYAFDAYGHRISLTN